MIMKIANALCAVVAILLAVPAGGRAQVTANAQPSAPVASRSVAYQINPRHTGATDAPEIKPPLHVKWSVNLNNTVSYPLIAEGKVFVLAGQGENGNVSLYALDAQTGGTIWGPILIPQEFYNGWGAAAYENGKIFVIPDVYAGAGGMTAFSAADGSILWQAILSGQYEFSSPPTAYGGVVYTSGQGENGTVYAVSEADGSILWTGIWPGSNSSPAVTKDGVYFSAVCGAAISLNPETGAVQWGYAGTCGGGGGYTSVLYDGSLYVRTGTLSPPSEILDAENGTLTGSFNSVFAPAFWKGAAIYTQTSGIQAVATSGGGTLWSAAPPEGDSFSSPPIVVNAVVYVGTASGLVLGYSVTDGSKMVSINLGQPISAIDSGYLGAPLAGLGAGEGIVVVPASTYLFALSSTAH
jgi:hypothetical protein